MTTADITHPEMTNNNTDPSFEALATQLLANSAERVPSLKGQLVYRCELNKLISVLKLLKSNESLEFAQLSDLTAVDYPGRIQRFELVYQLLSITHNRRIRIICAIDE